MVDITIAPIDTILKGKSEPSFRIPGQQDLF